MKKLAFLITLFLMLQVCILPIAASDQITVIVDGTTVLFDTPPIKQNDRVLIPLRAVGETLGATVHWDEETQTVSIYRRGIAQHLTLGNPNASLIKDGLQTTGVLDVPPFTVNDRTMVPVRYIAESFDATVDWQEETNTVVIISNNPVVMTIDGLEITEGIYNLFLCTNAALLVNQYYDETQNSTMEEFFASKNQEGKTIANAVIEQTEFELKASFGFQKKAIEEGITLSDQDLLDSLGASNAAELEAQQKTFLAAGMTSTEFNAMTVANAYANQLYTKKLNTSSYEELKDLYQKSYVTVKHILLNTENATPEKQAEAKALAETIVSQLKQGGDFDALMKQYSEDPGLATNPDGYTFTKGEMVESFETASFALKEGEISGVIETNYGYHIIKRLPLQEKNPEELDEFRNQFAYNFMMNYLDQMEVIDDQTLINSFDLAQRYQIYLIAMQATSISG